MSIPSSQSTNILLKTNCIQHNNTEGQRNQEYTQGGLPEDRGPGLFDAFFYNIKLVPDKVINCSI